MCVVRFDTSDSTRPTAPYIITRIDSHSLSNEFDGVSAHIDRRSCKKTKWPNWSLFRLRDDFRGEGSQESSGEHHSCAWHIKHVPRNVQGLSLVLDQLLHHLRFKEKIILIVVWMFLQEVAYDIDRCRLFVAPTCSGVGLSKLGCSVRLRSRTHLTPRIPTIAPFNSSAISRGILAIGASVR